MINKVQIYDDLFYKRYQNPKLEPVIKSMEKVVKHFNASLTREINQCREISDRNKKEFISKLFPLFEDIVNSNNYEDLDINLEFLFSLHMHWFDFMMYLNLFYFKEDLHKYNSLIYFKKIRELCSYSVNHEDYKQSNNYLFQLLNCYSKKYYEKYNKRDSWKYRFFFDNYGYIIVGVVYLRYELKDLDEMLSKIIKNFEDIESFFILNGIDSIYNELDLNEKFDFVMNIINNKRKIKVIE